MSEALKETDLTQIKSDMRYCSPKISLAPPLPRGAEIRSHQFSSMTWCATFENATNSRSEGHIWRPSGSLVGSATALVPSQHAKAETTWSPTKTDNSTMAKGCQRPIVIKSKKAYSLDALKQLEKNWTQLFTEISKASQNQYIQIHGSGPRSSYKGCWTLVSTHSSAALFSVSYASKSWASSCRECQYYTCIV